MGGVKCTKKLIQYIFLLKVLYFNTPLTFFFKSKDTSVVGVWAPRWCT